MKTAIKNGHRVVVGNVLAAEEIAVGSTWTHEYGSNRIVQVKAVNGEQVQYGSEDSRITYETDYLDFQGRYYLIINS